MGNVVARKELDKVELGKCTLHGDEGHIHVLNITTFTHDTVRLKGNAILKEGRGYEFLSQSDGRVIFRSKASGFGRKATCYDGSGKEIAFLTIKKVFEKDEQHIFRSTPAYEGQAPSPEGESRGRELYLFAKIDVERTMNGAESVYSVVIGQTDDGEPRYDPLYKAQKFRALKFYAVISMLRVEKKGDIPVGTVSVPVAKMVDGGVSKKGPRINIEAARCCDLAAIILVGQSCAPSGAAAGAMAGAGVY